MRRQSIFYNALLLTGVNLLLRLVGTSFQVYLSARIGAEGIGLLQLVMSVGSMAMVAGMAGIRTATMYLTAEELGKGRPQNICWVLSACLVYSLLISGSVGALLYFFAPPLALEWVGNAYTAPALRLLAAALPINCLCGVMVGYFTGAGRVSVLAAVEVAEQLCSMLATLFLLTCWAGTDVYRSCQAVILGNTVGACLTLSCLTVLRLLEKAPRGNKCSLRSRLLQTAVPLALADDLRTGISTVENLMVPKRLALYPGTASPLAAFGTVCGMVFPVLMFPQAILFGLNELLVPELARCRAAGSRQRISHLVQKSLRIALLYGAACAGILYLSAESLCERLYHSAEAGEYLRWFAPLALMLYCDSVTDAMVKGLGQQRVSVRYNIITNTMDVAFLFVLLPKYGISGYFFSFFITHAINLFLSLRRLLLITGERISMGVLFLTLLADGFAVAFSNMVAQPALRIAAFSCIFTCVLFLFRVVSREDLSWLRGLICPAEQ